MKDPCDDCLVQVNCSEFCWEKQNYTTLVENAYRMHMGRTGLSNPNVTVKHKFNDMYYKDQMQRMKIKRRGLK